MPYASNPSKSAITTTTRAIRRPLGQRKDAEAETPEFGPTRSLDYEVEVGFYVPPNPARMMDPRPNRPQVIQSCDCYVDRDGVMYLTDPNAGLYILQFEGA